MVFRGPDNVFRPLRDHLEAYTSDASLEILSTPSRRSTPAPRSSKAVTVPKTKGVIRVNR